MESLPISLLRTSPTAHRSVDLVHAARESAAADALEPAHEGQVFGDLHFRVKRRRFGQVTDAFLHFDGVFEDIEAGHAGGAGGGRQEAGEHAHGGGFTGAVGPEKAYDLALFHFEGDVVYSDSTSVSLGQPLL